MKATRFTNKFKIMKIPEYTITTIKNYPDNGEHQQCNLPMPFEIRKGEDGYYYKDKKGEEKAYNLHPATKAGKWKPTKKWICHLKPEANESLKSIFATKESLKLDTLVEYCTKLYVKSLAMEIKRINKEFESFK